MPRYPTRIMQRTNAISPACTPTSSESESTSTISPENSKVEILWLSGPNQFANEHALLQSLLKKTNLTHIVYGDGNVSLTTQHIKKLIHKRLAPGSHVFFNGHGNATKEKHFIQLGDAHTTDHYDAAISSHDLLRMVRKNSSNTDKKTSSLHIATCHAGAMRNEIKPGSESWKQAYLMLYSGKKETVAESMHDSLAASLQYLESCKSRQIETDPFDLFLHAINGQGDCITLLGGDLHAPLISHAPKTPKDLTLEGRENRIHGNNEDLAQLKKHSLTLREDLELSDAEKIKQYHAMLYARIERHDHSAIRKILNMTPNLIHSKDQNGLTPLMFACEENNLKIINLLLSSGADTESTNEDQETPLIWSVMGKNEKITAALLEHGASISAQNNHNENALFIACYMEQTAMVRLLLAHGAANFIDQPNHKGKTALMCAAKNGHLTITKLLLAAGAKTNLKDYKGQTALTIANNQNYPLTAELITQNNKLKNRPSIIQEINKLPENLSYLILPTSVRNKSVTNSS